MVHRGVFRVEYRDKIVALHPGELHVVPHGVEHRTASDEEAEVVIIEPRGSSGGEPVGAIVGGAAKFTLPGDDDLEVLLDAERRACESLFDSATGPLADFLAELLHGPLPVATMRQLIGDHVGDDITPESCLWSASREERSGYGGERQGRAQV